MVIIAKCWNIDRWVRFRLTLGEYANLVAFLNANQLSFLSEMDINITNVPISLRGRGNSKNLLEYISNNVADPTLIFKFVSYFLNGILDVRYDSGKKLIYSFNYSDRWQEQSLQVSAPYVPPTTELPTTTQILLNFEEPI